MHLLRNIILFLFISFLFDALSWRYFWKDDGQCYKGRVAEFVGAGLLTVDTVGHGLQTLSQNDFDIVRVHVESDSE